MCTSGPQCTDSTNTDAIQNADANDVILVEPGIYMESPGDLNKRLTIQSTTPVDPGAVTIDGGGARIFNVRSDTTLIGLTLINGNVGGGASGGAVYLQQGSTLVIVDCRFVNSSSSSGNGGRCSSSTVS